MKKEQFEAIVFKGLFEVNNEARKERGAPLLNFDDNDKRNGWKHYGIFRDVMKRHIDRLYDDLKLYLED